jgi:hypothetical protein
VGGAASQGRRPGLDAVRIEGYEAGWAPPDATADTVPAERTNSTTGPNGWICCCSCATHGSRPDLPDLMICTKDRDRFN